MSYGSQVLNQLFLGHADPEILNGKLIGGIICRYADFVLKRVIEDVFFGELESAQFLEGIRCIGNQFPDKDFLILIEGIDDDIENLLGLGLEFVFLGLTHFEKGWMVMKDPISSS